LVDPERADGERGKVVRGAIAALERGRSVVICTAVAPDDPRIAETLDLGNERGLPPHATRERIGDQLGRVLRELLDTTSIRRVVVAGGDTSGHVVRQVGIEVLEVILPLTPGSPLCRATSRRASVDGLEIVLKGGQIGRPDFFGTVLRGEA
jgi:3-oxoisoapionate kinase